MESLANLCRCCLSPETIVSLLNDDGDVREQFLKTTSVKVKEGDGLPEKLCNNCYSLMLSAYQFRSQCIKIDKELRIQLQATTLNNNNNFSEYVSQVNVTEDMTLEDLASASMKQLEDIIKQEPNDNDDDFYYVVVVNDDENEKEAQQINDEKNISMTIESITPEDQHMDDLDLDEADQKGSIPLIQDQNDASNSQFENCIDSFLVSNPKVSAHVPATILENEEEQEVDRYKYDSNSMDAELSQDQTLAIIDNSQDKSDDQFSVAVTEDIIKNLSNKKFIKILTTSGAERTILLKSNDNIKYVTEPNMIKTVDDDYMPEEVIFYDGGEESELQILKCDASELIIEYADGGNIATVIQQDDGTFLCECGEQFADLTSYQAHQIKHKPAEDHLCNLCGKGFESSEILAGHILLHNTTGLLVTCPFCNQNIKRNTLTQHIKYTHNSKPQCNLCKKTFANQNNLKRHMMIHTGVKDFECDVCKKRFHQKITMQTHKLTHINPFTCSQCGMKCDNKMVLAAHKGTEECTKIRKMKVKEELMKTVKQEIMTNAGKLLGYACSLCKKMFSVESALEQHVENKHIVDGDDPNSDAKLKRTIKRFECIICGKGCSSQAMLVMHERVHTNERPFPCQLCSLRFKTKTHLRTHQLTHTREKKFGCSVCMKFFALKGNLVVHLRTHTGERPYVCGICGDAYIDSKYLKKHKQKKHSIDNVPWNKYD